MGLNRNAVAYAATSLASSMMNNVFFFYYVKLFLDKYKLTSNWFQFAQVVYMIWNAINDPLFGYFQDHSNWSFCRSRKKAIYYGAPLWALTFLLPWFQWVDYEKSENGWIVGVHLIVSLCAYDALLTFVLLAQCALSAEISTRHEDRLQLVKYSQVGSVIGSSSVFISSVLSNNMENFLNLQLYCIAIAFVAFFFMRYTGANVQTKYEGEQLQSAVDPLLMNNTEQMSPGSYFIITKQILGNRNFLAFVLMNFFQVFHNTFCSNFMLIFASHLIPQGALPSAFMSAIYGASFILPQLCILLGGNMISKFGAYRVVMISFFVQIIAALIVYIFGNQSYWLVAIFFILDMTIPSACFSLFNILLSDIIDEDMKVYSRKHPQSSMVFGTNALITKPANSLAPMIVVALLNNYGYEHLKQFGSKDLENEPQPNPVELGILHATMFQILCFIPIIVSALQIFVWSSYKLRNSHTADAKYIDT